MSITTTLGALRAGEDVILNLGMGDSQFGAHVPFSQKCRVYARALREIMEIDWKMHLLTEPPPNESTMVVCGRFLPIVEYSDLVMEMTKMAGQDSIAIYYPVMQDGFIYGTNPEPYQPFDLTKFKLEFL